MKETNNSSHIPKLRFPGFTGEWKEKKIGDVADVLQGFGFPDKYQGQKSGDLPFCKVGDISSAVDRGEQTICKAANYVDYSLLPALHAQPIPVGATIFAKIGEAIRSNKRIKTGVPCLIDNNAAAVKAKDGITDDFLFYVMSLINLADYSGGIVPSVNKSTIEAISILLPPTPEEQQKIASCLSEMDEMISAQAQKVESLKAHKKGLMQQMFPQQGKTTPRLRFPGFEGEWEEKKLEKVFSRIIRKNTENNQNVLTISAQYGLISQLDFFKKSVAAADVTGYYLLNKGEFAYNKSSSQGKPVGAIKPLKLYDKGVVSTLYICFKCNDPKEIDFWEQYFDAGILDNEIASIAQEGARNHGLLNIPTSGFFELNVTAPTLPEMKKIAGCLSLLDDNIAAEADKLEALKNHKKALMQQLFPQPAKQ